MRKHIVMLALAGCAQEETLADVESELATLSRGEDIVVLGSSASAIVVGFARDAQLIGDPTLGTFEVVHLAGTEWFANLAKTPGVKRLSGDFNGDGRIDFALVGVDGWNGLPTALSNSNGTYSTTSTWVGLDFHRWAITAGAKVLVADLDNDRRSDIAITGGQNWNTIPVARSLGNGQFTIYNNPSGLAAFTHSAPAERILVGDYNRDGYSDIAVVTNNWCIPIAFGWGAGTWQFTCEDGYPFTTWASAPQVKTHVADFNRDGFSDIALTGGTGWNTLPVAYASGGGRFQIWNIEIPVFADRAGRPGVDFFTGDYNGDGFGDLTALGSVDLQSIATASGGSGGVGQTWHPSILAQVTQQHQDGRVLSGDFNGDRRTDLAFIFPSYWGVNWIPVAFGQPDTRWFDASNTTNGFNQFAGDPNASLFVGHVN